MLHCGDFLEGNGKQYKGQIFEMFLHGVDNMVEYATEIYPRRKNIETLVIGGGHDYSYWKSEGFNILELIAERRSDIKYLGQSGAYANFGRVSTYLFHPSGGIPYARSYRLQKVIEQFPPNKKPSILLVGHLHCTCSLPVYNGVAGFQVPCFQDQTIYLREKGLNPDLGFMIMEIFPNVKGLEHFKVDWRPFYESVKGDY